MQIPQFIIDDLKNQLVEILSTLSTSMPCDDVYEWAWSVDNKMLFEVRIENMDTIYVNIHRNLENVTIPVLKTSDPEKVLQKARKFKSKYIDLSEC